VRILILSWRDFAHPRAGGSEVYSQQLAHHWATAGHEVTYFAASVEGAPAEEVVDGYRLVRRGSALGVYREARRFYRDECRGRTDWVLDVVNTRPFLTPLWVDDAPVTALVHQVCREVWRYETPLPVALLGRHWLEPRWLHAYRDTPVLTVSESSRRSLQAYGLRRVAVVPEGVEVPPVSHPKEPVPTLLWVGRLSPNKRPDHAIAAFRQVRQSVPEARLWVVGAGPMEDRLRRRAPEGAVICGRVDQAKKFELMARAHLSLATSVREGWGLTVSEAALCGTRTVAYDVDGLRDSVTAAGGVLVEPAPGPLARATLEVLTGASSWSAPTNVADVGVSDWVDVSARVLSGRADDSSVHRAARQTDRSRTHGSAHRRSALVGDRGSAHGHSTGPPTGGPGSPMEQESPDAARCSEL